MTDPAERIYRAFSWKDTNLRVACDLFELVTAAVVAERRLLEGYIVRHPAFKTSLVPVVLQDEPPESARRMAAAADATVSRPDRAAVSG